MTQQDHAAAVQAVREFAWHVGISVDLDQSRKEWADQLAYVADMAEAALKLERALRAITEEVRAKAYSPSFEHMGPFVVDALDALAAVEQARQSSS